MVSEMDQFTVECAYANWNCLVFDGSEDRICIESDTDDTLCWFGLNHQSARELRDWLGQWLDQHPEPAAKAPSVVAGWGAEVVGISDTGKLRLRLHG